MQKIFINFSLILLFSAIIFSCKESSTEPKLELDAKLIGTWELTKIKTSIAGQDVELTPQAAGISSTVTFKSDGTFESVNTDSDGTTNDKGTWGTSNGNLTITITGEEPETAPYTFIDDNNVSIDRNIEISGNQVFATLTFTKQN